MVRVVLERRGGIEQAHLWCPACGRRWSVRSWQGPLREVADRDAARHEERCAVREVLEVTR